MCRICFFMFMLQLQLQLQQIKIGWMRANIQFYEKDWMCIVKSFWTLFSFVFCIGRPWLTDRKRMHGDCCKHEARRMLRMQRFLWDSCNGMYLKEQTSHMYRIDLMSSKLDELSLTVLCTDLIPCDSCLHTPTLARCQDDNIVHEYWEDRWVVGQVSG